MFFYQVRRMKRTMISSLAVLVFAAVLTFILCSLHISSQREQAEYERVVRETPIILEVTNLNGTMKNDLELPNWAVNVFMGGVRESLKEYVKDVRIESSFLTKSMELDHVPCETPEWKVTGIRFEGQIPLIDDQKVNWLPGYDGAVLATSEKVCLIPESLAKDGMPQTVTLHFFAVGDSPTDPGSHYYDLELTVAGTYPGTDIYCPFIIMRNIYSNLGKTLSVGSISAVLIDNDLQEEATERARQWFPAPDLSGKRVPWDYSWYTYHPFALRVDDSQLLAAKAAVENSMMVNSICTVLVFVISAAAGALVGFLMIRSRKKEIMLMRTMGTGNLSVFCGLLFEQMACLILGTAAGGIYGMWQPVERLGMFVAVYAIGLSVALVIFLNSNLLSTAKEDE